MILAVLFLQLVLMLLYRAVLRRAGKGGVGFREAAIIAPAVVPALLMIVVFVGLWDYSTVYGWTRAISFLWWGPVGAIAAWLLGHVLIRWTLRQISDEGRP
jgi:ABC-type sugar transport system permease subunit